jgi:predicted O-methyltransferase YrrM
MVTGPPRVESFVRGVRFRLSRKLRDRAVKSVWPGISDVEVRIRPYAERYGNVKLQELVALCSVAKHVGARTIFEFGTFDGLTTWHIAANCRPEAKIWTLDLPLDHPARARAEHDRTVGKIWGVGLGEKFVGSPEAGHIEQLYADSLAFDPTSYRGRIDFCFIDAGHGYGHVLSDTENALQMASPGGVIFWHDYSRWWPAVQQVLDNLAGRFPVFRIEGTSLAALNLP